MKPRGPDGTLQVRIFRLLRDVGSFDADRIGERVGVSRGGAHTACRYIMARGLIAKRKMNGRWVLYTAVGKQEPEDRRGKSPGSRNSCYANVLAMMRSKCGPHWRPKIKGIELDSAWPFPTARNRCRNR